MEFPRKAKKSDINKQLLQETATLSSQFLLHLLSSQELPTLERGDAEGVSNKKEGKRSRTFLERDGFLENLENFLENFTFLSPSPARGVPC